MNKKDQEIFDKFKRSELNIEEVKSFSEELWINMVLMDGTLMSKISEEVLTDEMIKLSVKYNPSSIRFVKNKDSKFMNELLEINYNAVRFLDNFKFNSETAKKALKDDISFLSYCPDSFFTIENFIRLINEKSISAKEKEILKKKDIAFKEVLISKCPKSISYFKDDLELLENILVTIGNELKEKGLKEAQTMFYSITENLNLLDKDKVVSLFEKNVLLYPYLPEGHKTEENTLKCLAHNYIPQGFAQTAETCYQGLSKSILSPIFIDEEFAWILKAVEDSRFVGIKEKYEDVKKKTISYQKAAEKLTEKYLESDFDVNLERELEVMQVAQGKVEDEMIEIIDISEELFGKNVWYINKEPISS